jgi:hypothetical protein
LKKILLIAIIILISVSSTISQTNSDSKFIRSAMDSFSRVSYEHLKTKIANLYDAELGADPTAEVIVAIEFGKQLGKNKRVSWLKSFDRCFKSLKVDRGKFTFVIAESGSSEMLTTFWLFQKDDKFDIILKDAQSRKVIKGENLRQEMPTIFK